MKQLVKRCWPGLGMQFHVEQDDVPVHVTSGSIIALIIHSGGLLRFRLCSTLGKPFVQAWSPLVAANDSTEDCLSLFAWDLEHGMLL